MAKNQIRFDEVDNYLANGGSIEDLNISMEPTTSKVLSLVGIEADNLSQTTLLDDEDCWN